MAELEDEGTLDIKCINALASDVRIGILRALVLRRWTLVELSKRLSLPKSTVHLNLKILNDSGLVKKSNYKSKWVYYELTDEGQRITRAITNGEAW
ncbi:MAG: winged helix-turn-helix domain-containing protein [Halobacteriota archaeon]|nr:winged helix-turn-helix domain-containing protein [Halobacteriota archaeon]